MRRGKILCTSFYEDQDFFAEEIFNAGFTPAKQFLLYNKSGDSLNFVENFEVSSGSIERVSPLDLDLIDDRTVLLPSSVDDKTTEAELEQKILTFLHHWLDIEKLSEQLCLFYIKMTWIYDRLSVVPYLRALGDYGSGKTRFVQTVGSLSYKPMFLAGATSDAYLFRVIELFKGTMVLNELERVNTDLSAQIVNILNNGYEKGIGVGRVEGDKTKTPVVYDVFSPKIISSRERFKDLALESRIITSHLYPTTRKEIPIALDESFWKEAEKIRNALLGYRFRMVCQQTRSSADPQQNQSKSGLAGLADFSLKGLKGNILYGLEPRLRQTLFPLFYVIPENKVKEFVDFAKEYQQEVIEDRGFELEGIVAKSLLDLLDNNEEISAKDLRVRVNEELDNDKFKVSPQKIGKILKSWGLKTRPVGHEKIPYIVNNDSIFNRLRSRFGAFDYTSKLTDPYGSDDEQYDSEKERFLDQAETFLSGVRE